MKMFVIEDRKKEKISRGLNKMLHIGGMLMQCVENMEEADEDMEEEYGYGERDYDEDIDPVTFERDTYGNRMAMRGGMGMREFDGGNSGYDSRMGMRRRRR